MVDYLFVLIPGTWASKTGRLPFMKPAEWVANPDHKLRKRIIGTFANRKPKSKITFERLWWHSRNRVSCRDDGAIQGAEMLDKILSEKGSRNIHVYLIAHSHGSDVAYGICQKTKFKDNIKGVVAFNSPNINFLRRDFFRNIGNNFKTACNTVILFIFTLLISIAMSLKSASVENFWEFGGAYGDQLGIAAIFAIAILAGKRRYKAWSQKITRYLAKKDKAETFFPNVSVLCANSSGDEAWNILSVLGSISQIPFYFTHKVAIYISTIIYFFYLNISLIYGNALTKKFFENLYILGELYKEWTEISETDIILRYIASIPMSLLAAILISLAVTFSLMISGYILSYIYNVVALGCPWKEQLTQVFANRGHVSIIPLRIRDVTFYDTGFGSRLLNHSAPYDDSRAIRRMCSWIK